MPRGGHNAILFALAVAIIKPENTNIFKYLWDKFSWIWDYKALKESLMLILDHLRKDLLIFLMESRTT
jgi:hypothetical protein